VVRTDRRPGSGAGSSQTGVDIAVTVEEIGDIVVSTREASTGVAARAVRQ
jgi:hypothetical protein